MHFLTAGVVHEGNLNVTHLVRDKGAIRSTPRLGGTALLIMGMPFEAPFFKKRRSPPDPESSRTLIV